MTNHESTDYNTFLPFIDAPYTFIETSCFKHKISFIPLEQKNNQESNNKKLKKKDYDKKILLHRM